MNVLVGADPEMFVAHAGQLVSGIGMIGGSKYNPRPVDKGAIQEDNVLAEFNIDPASCEDEFVGNIQYVIQQLQSVLPPKHTLECVQSYSFTEAYLRGVGPEAFIFGCDPDFNAWTGKENPKPKCDDVGFRTAGGHIHVGFDHHSEEDCTTMIQMMDYFLGIPSVLLDKDTDRRKLYGKAGCMRFKPYGVEYRTLSNFWIGSEELIRWAYRGTMSAVRAFSDKPSVHFLLKELPQDEVFNIINNSDKAAASEAMDILSEVA